MAAEQSERRKRQLWADRHPPGNTREDFRPRDVNKQLPDGDSDVQYVRSMASLRNIPGLFTEGNFHFEMKGGERDGTKRGVREKALWQRSQASH